MRKTRCHCLAHAQVLARPHAFNIPVCQWVETAVLNFRYPKEFSPPASALASASSGNRTKGNEEGMDWDWDWDWDW
jgi:hypothetical protein